MKDLNQIPKEKKAVLKAEDSSTTLLPHVCQGCETCKEGCCSAGKSCKHSNVLDELDNEIKEGECYAVANESGGSVFFRKSTRLLFSGLCMIVVTGISIADIVTDVLTSLKYYQSKNITAFIISVVFIAIPPIILTAGIIKRRDDDSKNTGQTRSCGIKFLIVLANVPLKLYMIWLQIHYSIKCFKRYHKWRIARCKKNEETLIDGTLQHFVTELSLYKLWNSVFESMPQLLLTIHVIMTTPNVLNSERYLLFASAVFSFGSLCAGVIFYAIKSKEAETKPFSLKPGITHPPLRAKDTTLDLPQIVFMFVFTVCFLSARVLSFSYFIVFFHWYAAILPAAHWLAIFLFFSFRRLQNKNDRMQGFRLKAYNRQSSSFIYVLVHSLMSVFIHIKPESEELLDQPRYYKIIYYFVYTIENCFMMLMPFALKNFIPWITTSQLESLQYLPVTYMVIGLTLTGSFICALYHYLVHKSAQFTREEVFGPCCKCCFGPGGFLCFSCKCCYRNRDESKVFITCKNIHTHEIFEICLRDVRRWKQSTESRLLNKTLLRKWKIAQNTINALKRMSPTNHLTQSEDEIFRNNTDNDCKDKYGTECLYTMRRSGLYILSDPKGNLFYAPIRDVKPKRSFLELKVSRV